MQYFFHVVIIFPKRRFFRRGIRMSVTEVHTVIKVAALRGAGPSTMLRANAIKMDG
jgi:hypothetical protein